MARRARGLLRKTRERRPISGSRDCYRSYSLILILRDTLIANQSLRLNTSNSPLAIVHKQSKYLRHIKQAKQTLQRKQSCAQEQSFAIVTWLYHYGFIWYFFVLYFCPVVFNSSILNSSFAITPVVTGNERRARVLRKQDP
jgi:hypothetical protein